MSQLLYTAITTGTIATLSRDANGVVSVTLAAAASGTPLPVGAAFSFCWIVTIKDAAPADFNGSYCMTSGNADQTHFTYQQAASLGVETGSGGTLSVSPAQFNDLPDSSLVANKALTQVVMQALAHNGFFAAVRCEFFDMGYYRDADAVPAPVSPVDGYVYKLAECLFILILASSRQPDNGQFTPGQATFPVLANNDVGNGNLIVAPYELLIDPTTGRVTCEMYFSDSGVAHQGTVRVVCVGQRLSG
jgi:hypothetical protein